MNSQKRVFFVSLSLCVYLGIGSLSQANSPDDQRPTPEQRLQAAGAGLSVAELTATLQDESADRALRYLSAIALGRTGDATAAAALQAGLRSTDPQLRVGAVIALGELGVERSAAELAAMLHDSDRSVRSAAVGALAAVGGQVAVAALAKKVADASEDAVAVRVNAAYALARIEGTDAIPLLRATLSDKDRAVAAAAAIALARLQDEYSVPYLVDTALAKTTAEWMRVDAIRALEKLVDRSFGYVKPYSAPTTKGERTVALERVKAWWRASESRYSK